MVKRKYYAKKSPRGFGNEWDVYEFPNKRTREDFVREGYSNRITSKEAHKMLKPSKDQYNDLLKFYTIDHISKQQCEESGGTWVEGYRRSDGTKVKGYCRYFTI